MLNYIGTIKGLFSSKNLSNDENSREKERERRIVLTSVTSVIQKVISTAIPLITLRITYDYLGVETYGLWSAVTNFFALFSFSDLGLGNGLQTKLSQASGTNDIDLCQKLIASTTVVLLLVAVLLLCLFLGLYPFVDWASLMNAHEEETILLAAPIVFVIVLPRIIQIPITIINRTQFALQEGYITNCWDILGSIISLVYIAFIAHFDLGKVTLLLGTAMIPVVVAFLNLCKYYITQRPDLRFKLKQYDKKIAQNLLKLGISFCVLSVLTTLSLSMDTFVVAKTCDLSLAGSYSIIYKVSIIISAVLGIFAQPLWGANGEAIARGDVAWVKKNTNRMSVFMTAITLLGTLVLILSSRWVFKIWMGDAFAFSMPCLIWMCIMQIFQAFISPYFMVLNAIGSVWIQVILFSSFTVISFALKFWLAPNFGIEMIPSIGAVGYLIFIVFPIYLFTKKALSKYAVESINK